MRSASSMVDHGLIVFADSSPLCSAASLIYHGLVVLVTLAPMCSASSIVDHGLLAIVCHGLLVLAVLSTCGLVDY